MATRNTLSTRWVTMIMVAALGCSVAVVWGLIQITGGSPAASSTPSVSASDSSSASAAVPGATGEPVTELAPLRPSTSSGAPPTSGATAPLVTTVVPTLPGSGLPLPAAWTGTAELTITVLGRCATAGGTSSYTRTAELALQGPVVGSGPIDDPNPISMTLGITPADIPGVSIYSASVDDAGAARRTWWLTAGADPDGRTQLSGILIDNQPVRGVLPPNLLVDNETDLQPCESGGTVRVPRPLAAGSTVTGWVSPTQAHLDLAATTADGERVVTAVVDLSRSAGP